MSEMGRRPLRVLYITHEPNLTGASRSLLDLLGALDRSEVEPAVLVGKHGPLTDKLDAMNIRWKCIAYLQCVRPSGSRDCIKAFAKKGINAVAVPRVVRFMRKEGFDVVHCNSLLTDVGPRAAYMAQLPYVEHVREFVHEDHHLDFMDELTVRKGLRRSHMNVFISHAVEDKFLSWAPDTPNAVMYDGIDSGLYDRTHVSLFSTVQVKLLMAGRIVPGKGQLEAVRGLDELRHRGINAQLVIIGESGDDAYRDEILTYIKERRLTDMVKVLDFTDDLADFRAESDICLTCSSNEAMGRVTVEAMMAGCLVVAANFGATKELVTDGETGLLYEWGHPESLADKVQWAINHPDQANQIARSGKKWALDAFDVDKYAEKMVEVYRKIVS